LILITYFSKAHPSERSEEATKTAERAQKESEIQKMDVFLDVFNMFST